MSLTGWGSNILYSINCSTERELLVRATPELSSSGTRVHTRTSHLTLSACALSFLLLICLEIRQPLPFHFVRALFSVYFFSLFYLARQNARGRVYAHVKVSACTSHCREVVAHVRKVFPSAGSFPTAMVLTVGKPCRW